MVVVFIFTYGIIFIAPASCIVRFPSAPEERSKWEVAVRRDGFQSTKCSVLCSNQFRDEDFEDGHHIIW